MCLCGELVGDRLDDALDGKGSYREPENKSNFVLHCLDSHCRGINGLHQFYSLSD